ncbi:MAG: pepsin-like aspartic protease [Myxococcota bacterium]
MRILGVLLAATVCLSGVACKPKVTCGVVRHRVKTDDHVNILVEEGLEHEPSEYFVDLHVGDSNKPQTIHAVADTGSANLILQGKGCNGCREKTRYAPSKIAVAMGDPYSLQYGSGNAMVQPVRDQIALQCGPSFPYTFAMITESKNIPNVVGLAFPGVMSDPGHHRYRTTSSQGKDDTFLGQFFDYNPAVPRKFSLALCGHHEGGEIVIGGTDPRVSARDVTRWTPIVKQTYHVVPALSLWIVDGEKREKLGEFPDSRLSDGYSDVVILDSGSTFTVLPADMLNQLTARLQGIAQSYGMRLPDGFWNTGSGGKAVLASKSQLDVTKFPKLELVLAGGGTPDEADKVRGEQNQQMQPMFGLPQDPGQEGLDELGGSPQGNTSAGDGLDGFSDGGADAGGSFGLLHNSVRGPIVQRLLPGASVWAHEANAVDGISGGFHAASPRVSRLSVRHAPSLSRMFATNRGVNAEGDGAGDDSEQTITLHIPPQVYFNLLRGNLGGLLPSWIAYGRQPIIMSGAGRSEGKNSVKLSSLLLR